MHVGLLVPGSLGTVSGGYLYDRMLAKHLEQQGDRVTVFSLSATGYWRQLGQNVAGGWYERLRDSPVDILLQDELAHPSLFWLNRRLQSEVPLVSIVHHLRSSERHPILLRLIYQRVERAYLQTLDGFVYNSQTTKGVVERLAGRRRPGVVAYPAASHLARFISEEGIRSRALSPGPLRLLYVGNVIPRKGLDFLLEALDTLPAGSWTLDVVGNLTVAPVYGRRLRARVERMRSGSAIFFHGPVADATLPKYYANADLLAMPSRYEGFGIAYLEGMGYGLPAIAGSGGAAHEAVTTGRTGFLVGYGEVARLATHLTALTKNREWLAEMSVAAYRHYQAHPTWAESMARVRWFLLRVSGIR